MSIDGTTIAILVVIALVVGVVTLRIAARARAAGRTAAEAARAASREAVAAREEARSLAVLNTRIADLLDDLGIGLVHLGAEVVVTDANRAAAAVLGRDRRRLIDHPAVEAFADQQLVDLVATAQRDGISHVEISHGGPDGRTILARARRTRDGGLTIGLQDVSELDRLRKIHGELIDNLGHELRTPLTALGLLGETLARDVEEAAAAGHPVTQRMIDRLAKIQLETAQLTQLVTEMLELTRIEAGDGHPHGPHLTVDMVRVAGQAVERSRAFAELSGVGLVLDASAGAMSVQGDEDRLGRVLLNLLHNAVKFSPPGSAVEVRVVGDGRDVVTSVVDRGIGIPADAQSRIFERYYRVDRARGRGAGGTGLGLAIAKQIVETHGGRIWVESEEGVGSTFSFAIPAITPSAPEQDLVFAS
jgi:signal transduction histidine kinase